MRILLTGLVFALLAAACSNSSEPAIPADASTTPPATVETTSPPASYAGTVPAPAFPAGLDWLNTEAPIDMSQLAGKIVLLDFWTYGCINCIHIIPDLQRLEEEYAEELVVIGVHSAKFLNEGDTENIRQVVMRYGIEHPVVNDRDFEVWQSWGAQAWPTVALIDPAGNVIGTHAGEGVYDVVQPIIEGLVAEFDDHIDRTPFVTTPESATRANTVLSYPGNVAVDATGETVFVSDTGHNRVVVAETATGEITAVFGDGEPGFDNGTGLATRFHSPQGLAYDDPTGILYVADTNNHAIRAIDTTTGEVTTLAGTGQLGWPPAAGLVEDVRLNSPWGLTLREGRLWVAMAGFHQIWAVDIAGGIATPVVGSGLEGVDNGPLVEAALAQPSGVAFDGSGRLYFADSESSSIRWADVLGEGGTTGLLAGSGENLFDFGDIDGTGDRARLQHPLGIAWDEAGGDLIIADTYNNKLKRINPTTGETTTFLGAGRGWNDGSDPLFYDPGGLAVSDQIMFVADTNNHVIRKIDLPAGDTTTLVLHGIENFDPPGSSADFPGTVITLEPAQVAPGEGVVTLAIELPPGHKVNEDAPSSIVFDGEASLVTLAGGNEQSITGARLPIDIDATFRSGTGTLTADVTLLYCRDDSEGLCVIEQVRFVQPLDVTDGGSSTILLPHEVVLPNF
jgi:DNA-binding beta-propeller fold protein YncE